MDEADSNIQKNIVIRKVKKINPPEFHGGSWKLAYADFVTALMAFFLLLWLLNTVPSDKLKNVAEYFEPTLGILVKSGVRMTEDKEKTESDESKNGQKVSGIQYGVKQTGKIIDIEKQGVKVNTQELDNKTFITLKKELEHFVEKSGDLSKFKKEVSFYEDPQGLVIQVTDEDKNPLFAPGSSTLTPYAKNILLKISKLIKLSPNFIKITGHTDKTNYNSLLNYTNWELSADRANAARRFMISQGISPERFAEIVAMADTDPIDQNNPYSPKNRRIAITLLRNSIMPFYKISAPTEEIK